MRSSYRRDIGAGNTHKVRITLTEVAASTWFGDVGKVLEKGEPFSIHCPSRVCVREPHWTERQPLSLVFCICPAPALAPGKGPGWRARDEWFLLWWEWPRQAVLETLLLAGNLAAWSRVEVGSSHCCQHPKWPGSFSSFLLALTDSWDFSARKAVKRKPKTTRFWRVTSCQCAAYISQSGNKCNRILHPSTEYTGSLKLYKQDFAQLLSTQSQAKAARCMQIPPTIQQFCGRSALENSGALDFGTCSNF